MIRKVSQSEIESGNVKVRRKMGAEKPKPQAAPPKKKEVPMASMSASMQHLEAQADATRQVIAHNSLMIDSFRQDLKEIAEKVNRRVPYVFDIERREDKLIERIVATPQEN